MLLTLCACGDTSEKEFEAAKALYDAGDYENAMEALQNVGHYAEITGMIEDAQKQLTTENYEFLFYAAWKDTAGDGTDALIFHEDGTCDMDGVLTQYTVGNGKVDIAGGMFVLKITQENGIYRLVGDNTSYVREEDFDRFIADHTVALTLDNYLDYFEWTETRWEDADASLFVERDLQLKEAYKNRINSSLSEAEVEKTYEQSFFWGENFTINFDTLEYSGGSYLETEIINKTSSLDATGTVFFICADHYCMDGDSVGYVYICSKPEIVRVEGHLVIR